jgi:plasmid stabilization system protein ParE
VATVVYAPNALSNLERAFAHLAAQEPDAARAAASAIREAVELLAHHPFIGRAVGGGVGLRELVISFGRTGYVALYRFVATRDQIRILAIRHQRELGYPAP